MNSLESEVRTQLESQGYHVLHRGWPDFLAIKGRKVRLIEVKSDSDKVTEYQRRVHKVLSRRFGVHVEIVHRPEELDKPLVDQPEPCHAICAYLSDSGEYSEATSLRVAETIVDAVWTEVQIETGFEYSLPGDVKVFDMVVDAALYSIDYPWLEKKCVMGPL